MEYLLAIFLLLKWSFVYVVIYELIQYIKRLMK
jgi:hypothetical protein